MQGVNHPIHSSTTLQSFWRDSDYINTAVAFVTLSTKYNRVKQWN